VVGVRTRRRSNTSEGQPGAPQVLMEPKTRRRSISTSIKDAPNPVSMEVEPELVAPAAPTAPAPVVSPSQVARKFSRAPEAADPTN
jgi:hypothetical protein